jgi:CBS domain protein
MKSLARPAVALADDASSPDIASSPLLERHPLAARPQDSVATVLSAILAERVFGVVVLDDRSGYLGMCTLRSLADLALLVSADSARPAPRLDYHREGVGAMAARLAGKGDIPVARQLDAAVPVLRGAQSVPQALATLIRRPPIAAVVAPDGAVLGLLTLESAMRALHARSGFAARPA